MWKVLGAAQIPSGNWKSAWDLNLFGCCPYSFIFLTDAFVASASSSNALFNFKAQETKVRCACYSRSYLLTILGFRLSVFYLFISSLLSSLQAFLSFPLCCEVHSFIIFHFSILLQPSYTRRELSLFHKLRTIVNDCRKERSLLELQYIDEPTCVYVFNIHCFCSSYLILNI